MSDWTPFEDSGGANNAYNVDNGWQLHVHGADFGGPANFQNQSTGERYPMSSGDALYAAGMLDYAQQFLQND